MATLVVESLSRPPVTRSRRGSTWLVGLPWLATGACFLLPYTSQREARDFLKAALIVAAAGMFRVMLSAKYRRQCLGWLRARTEELEAYPVRRRSVPWLAVFCLVVIPALAVNRSSRRAPFGGDTWPVVPTAFSLLREGNLDLDEYLPVAPANFHLERTGLPYCVVRRGDHVYSSYPLGMVPTAVPVVAVRQLCGMGPATDETFRYLQRYVAQTWAALTAGLFFLLVRQMSSFPAAAWTTVLFVTGSVLFSTVSEALWQHNGVIFWSLMLLLIEFRRGKSDSPAGLGLQALACSQMLACRLSSTLFLAPFGLWMFARQPARAGRLALLAGLFFLPWAAIHGSLYGSPAGPSTHQLSSGNWKPVGPEAIEGLLISPARGLLVYQPWLLLGLCALLPGFRLRENGGGSLPRGWQAVCLGSATAQILLVASWECWFGGHCWGSRLLAETVPLLALLCPGPVAVLAKRRWGQAVLAFLVVVSFLPHAVGMYHNPCWEVAVGLDADPSPLWSWAQAPFLYPWLHP